MNYSKIYNNLVSSCLYKRGVCRSLHSAKEKCKGLGFHIHHIKPRCIGGSDKGINLVILTPREHFIAHWLLWKIHGHIMAPAFKIMLSTSSRSGIKINSKVYQSLCEDFLKMRHGEAWVNNNLSAIKKRTSSEEWRSKNAESVREVSKRKEWREAVSIAAKKRAKDPEWRRKNHESVIRVCATDEWKRKHREGVERAKNSEWWSESRLSGAKKRESNLNHVEKRRKNNVKNSIPVIGYDGNGTEILLIGVTEKIENGFKPSDISCCLSGRQKTHRGLLWKIASIDDVIRLKPDCEWLLLNGLN